MSELKPCPFCGGKASPGQPGYVHDVGCSNHFEVDPSICRNDGTYSYEEWNTRPIEDALRAENDQLEADLLKMTANAEKERQENERYKLALERLATAEYTYKSSGDTFVIVDKNGVSIDIQDIPEIAQSALMKER